MTAAAKLPETVLLPLAEIRLDGGTQSRAKLSDETIADYAEKYAEGLAMPAVVVFYDGASYWLADGFHRCAGAKEAGKDGVIAEIRQGTRRDAILHSVGANAAHGLRRTNADKRRAVEMVLQDEEWGARSDRWIAEKCGVGHQLVGSVREQLDGSSSSGQAAGYREGQDGKTRRVPQRDEPADEGTAEPEDFSDIGSDATAADPNPNCPGCGLSPNIGCVCAEQAGPHPAEPLAEPSTRAAPLDNEPEDEAAGYDPFEEIQPAWETLAEEERDEFIRRNSAVRVADLEALAEQRNNDSEFQRLRQVHRAIHKTIPSRAQRMLDFVLDGGELALLRLGLDWTVTPATLKRAYRAAAAKAHPDHGGSAERFRVVLRDFELVKAMLGETT